MAFLEGLITAVAPSLISGLFGRKSTTTKSRVNFQQMRDDAAAAGFNPLTALKATGGAGNVSTTAPNLSSGQFMAEAMGRGLDTWFNRDAVARDGEIAQINLELAREELTGLRNQNRAFTGEGFGYDVQNTTDLLQPQLRGGAPVQPPSAVTAPPALSPVALPSGESVLIGNQEEGVETPEWFAGIEIARNNPEYLRGLATDVLPWAAGAYGLYRYGGQAARAGAGAVASGVNRVRAGATARSNVGQVIGLGGRLTRQSVGGSGARPWRNPYTTFFE